MPARPKLVILDLKYGTARAVTNAFRRLYSADELEIHASADPSLIAQATHLVLPGVGSFDAAVESLSALRETLDRKVLQERTPILGICLGMQLMGGYSDEGKLPGLGWLKARCVPFPDGRTHIGWRKIQNSRGFSGWPNDFAGYFLHSFQMLLAEETESLTADHTETFTAGFRKENIWGAQFHPEKSGAAGLGLLRRFIEGN